jgi:NADPH-dependent 2,4-dienoyl-CoA reductase/sulfur reductase-like enzyme/nitrite reductase/ring-hydroxylating ferredoxin subunit
MATDQAGPTGPDLKKGISAGQVPDGGSLAGQVDGEAVLLARRGSEWFAIGATCSHYSGPLAEGIIVGETVRCPWHHACFSLRTGEPIRPPALNNLSCWRVEQRDGKVYVGEKLEPAKPKAGATRGHGPSSVLIIGAGAAGNSVSETLRREGYAGPIVMVDPDSAAPCDRPNLSKDFLAGNAPEDWIPLHPAEFYRDKDIELLRGPRVVALEPGQRRVSLDNGDTRSYGALVLATGASPVRLPPELEAGNPAVHYLRSLADSRAIIAAAEGSQRAVVLGASFIGLEVAASLRARKLEVHVVAPESRPLERVMGAALGDFIRQLHEEHGVIFHLGQTAAEIAGGRVILKNGDRLAADVVVVGIGVRPNLELAESAGLTTDRGLLVNEYLETSVPGIYAAGDVARWPDPHSGDRIRVEHWVVAERQGQTVARNILGLRERFDAVPFFWSQHYDVPINYVGHAEKWDAIDVDGDINARDCTVRFRRGSKTLAVATIYRDRQSLETELELEQAVDSKK